MPRADILIGPPPWQAKTGTITTVLMDGTSIVAVWREAASPRPDPSHVAPITLDAVAVPNED
jgi:hypothetical protein